MKFENYHPVINLIFFVSAVYMAIAFSHPVYIALSFIAFFAYSVKRCGKKQLVFNLLLIPLILLFTAYYSFYTHFGVTVIKQNYIGNSITLESVLYGLSIGMRAGTVLMIMSLVLKLFTSDRVTYLFGRVSPKLSLFISVALRMIPRANDYARKINEAQMCIGKGKGQGNIFRRFTNSLRRVYILLMWFFENIVEESHSMKARGYSLKGRTAFSIYRFDNRDRSIILLFSICITFIMSMKFLSQTDIFYNPQLIIGRITAVSVGGYIVYFIYLMLPCIIETVNDIRYRKNI
ncbi:MAG: energy-coupling factor transporter transmembrane protein EcfT [Clostridia bacterium]|nr:energy-coupling factor transporter transmembrane protein EcfT [Clostridia bacterium]